MYAKIDPVQVFPGEASVLFINNVSVRPGVSASFQWWLQSDSGTQLTQGTLALDGAAYQAWDVDTYLYEYTALQIGVTITEIVEPAAVAAAPVDPVDPAVV